MSSQSGSSFSQLIDRLKQMQTISELDAEHTHYVNACLLVITSLVEDCQQSRQETREQLYQMQAAQCLNSYLPSQNQAYSKLYKKGMVGKCFVSHVPDESTNYCFVVDLQWMPKTEELFGQCLIPMTYTPKINEMFAYKFNEIHVGRAIRLDPNGKNVALGCFEAILIDTGCRISVDIDAALQGDKLFHVTDAAKKIPAYARYCKVDKGSASLNSLLQQKCFYKIIDVDEYSILNIELLETNTNPFLYFNERDNQKTFLQHFQHQCQQPLNNINTPLGIKEAYNNIVDVSKEDERGFGQRMNILSMNFNGNAVDAKKSHNETQLKKLVENGNVDKNTDHMTCATEKSAFASNSNSNRRSGTLKYGAHFLRLSRDDLQSNNCNGFGDENDAPNDSSVMDTNDKMNKQQSNEIGKANGLDSLNTNHANIQSNDDGQGNVLDDYLHWSLTSFELSKRQKIRVISESNHTANCANYHENSDHLNSNMIKTQDQEYLIEANEELYPLEIPIGSVLKLNGKKHLIPLLSKIGQSLDATITVSINVEKYFLEISTGMEGYPSLDEMQMRINGENISHVNITELPEMEEMLLGRYYDGLLYRVKVVGTLSEEHIKVRAVDYGNCFHVAIDGLYHWYWNTNDIPFKAFECRLDNVTKVMDIDIMAIKFIQSRYINTPLKAVIKEVHLEREIVVVDLYDNGVNIGDDLCNRNFANWVEKIDPLDD